MAVYGNDTSNSGVGIGVEGKTVNGYGLFGNSTGGGMGVYGVSTGASGYGVYGYDSAANGTAAGVYGASASAQGYGVWGHANGTQGVYGVYGDNSSTSGAGVWGYGGNSGIYGSGGSQYGVQGSGPIGVYGFGSSTYGVDGLGTTYGVYGNGNTGGVQGVGGTFGLNGQGTLYGVYGYSLNNYGLYGVSGNGYGVYGTGPTWGLYTPNSTFTGGYLVVGSNSFTPSVGDIVVARGATTGVVYLGSNGGHYLYFDGTNYNMPSGNLSVGGQVVGSSVYATGTFYGPYGTYLTVPGYANTALLGIAWTGGNPQGLCPASNCDYVTLNVPGAGSNPGYIQLFDNGEVYMNGSLAIGGATASTNAGDITIARTSSPSTGYIFFGSNNSHFVGFDGSNYQMPNSGLNIGGSLWSNGTLIWSDRSLKDNITQLGSDSGLNVIEKLNPVSYTWKDQTRGTGLQYGFIAQDVQKVLPTLVSEIPINTLGPDGKEIVVTAGTKPKLSLNYEGLIAPMVKSIQEQQKEIEDLKQQIAELKAK
jgi:hypothetical protein